MTGDESKKDTSFFPKKRSVPGNIPIVRHLKDANDLHKYGMDNPLDDDQYCEAEDISVKIATKAASEGYKALLLITSSKKRAVETAHLMKCIISKKFGMAVGISINHNLRELDQGVLSVPKDYIPGEFIPKIARAWEIFWDETFIIHNNQKYRFGDPLSKDGTAKYPEIVDAFESYGECCQDMSLRLYKSAYSLISIIHRFSRVKPIVITHGAPTTIFKELENVANDIRINGREVSIGGIMKLTWDNFTLRKEGQDHPEFGSIQQVITENFLDRAILDRFGKEIEYLEKTK